MASRFHYWTIVVGDTPTAFRSNEREELLPTLKQLQSRHPEAALKWFERGKYWNSPFEAKEPYRPAHRHRRGHDRRADERRPESPDRRDGFRGPKGFRPPGEGGRKHESRARDDRRGRGNRARAFQPPGAERERDDRSTGPTRDDWRSRGNSTPRDQTRPREERGPQETRRPREERWRRGDQGEGFRTPRGDGPATERRPGERKPWQRDHRTETHKPWEQKRSKPGGREDRRFESRGESGSRGEHPKGQRRHRSERRGPKR